MKKPNVLIACEYSGTVRDAFENAGCNAWSCDLLPTESEQTRVSGKHIQGDVLRLFGERYISTEIDIDWHGFGMFGSVLMAEKNDIKNQVEIECGATACVSNGKPDMKVKLEPSSFPDNFNYEDFEIIGYSAKNEAYPNYETPKKWDLLIAHPPCTYLSYAYTSKKRYSIDRLQAKIRAYQFFLNLWRAPIEHICIENPMGYAHSGLLPCTQIIQPYYFGDPYLKRTCLWLKNLPKLEWHKNDLFVDGGTRYRYVEPEAYFMNGVPLARQKYKTICKPFSSGKDKSKFHKGIANAMAEQWTEYLKTIKN
jgi:hypothetical protein